MGVNGRLDSLILLCTLPWVESAKYDLDRVKITDRTVTQLKMASSNAAHPKNIALNRVFLSQD